MNIDIINKSRLIAWFYYTELTLEVIICLNTYGK